MADDTRSDGAQPRSHGEPPQRSDQNRDERACAEPVAGGEAPATGNRLYEVTLDDASLPQLNPAIAHEREVAIFDLLEENVFSLPGQTAGPYRLHLSIEHQRLVMRIGNAEEAQLMTHMLSLTPFKRIIKDYFLVCESYFEAIKTAPPSRIQAIDMGRRGLHDDGSHILLERLKGKVGMDFDTARRLFTLISVLHWKG